jgi:hypothetical protein
MPVLDKTSLGPLITSVSISDQVVASMLVNIDESVRDDVPAMYLQAHQLVQQRVPSWVEDWPEMPVAPPVETAVVAPWTAQPVVVAAPVVAARPLETGLSKVRPE